MTDKIKEIRARHEAGAPGQMPIVALAQADADREFLLAEVDRLRSVISTLEIVGKADEDERKRMQKEIERLTRERAEARCEVKRLREEKAVRNRIKGAATIQDAARRMIDEALEAKP